MRALYVSEQARELHYMDRVELQRRQEWARHLEERAEDVAIDKIQGSDRLGKAVS